MTTTARTVAEATVWTINEDALDTSAAMSLCLLRCEDSRADDGSVSFRFEDGSAITFDAETETFSHDLEC